MQFDKEIEPSEIQIDDIITVIDREKEEFVYTFKVGMINFRREEKPVFVFVPYSVHGFGMQDFPTDEWKVLNRDRIHRNIILEDMPKE